MGDRKGVYQRAVTVGILPDEDANVLIVQRADDEDTYPGMWQTPGGKVDLGEAPDDALEREYREETGLDVAAEEPLTVRHYWTPQRHNILIAYEVSLREGSCGELELNAEHQDHAWVGPGDVQDYDLINDVEADLHTFWEEAR